MRLANKLDIAELLLKNGADIESENLYNDTPLRMAAKADFLDMVILLLKYSANVNGCRKLGVHTPLHAVVKESGYIPVLEYLITHGADVNVVQEYTYESPLLTACLKNNKKVVELLLKYGADVNFKDKYGITPLQYVSYRGYYDIVKSLISHGADIYARNKYARTSIDIAIERHLIIIIRIFLSFEN